MSMQRPRASVLPTDVSRNKGVELVPGAEAAQDAKSKASLLKQSVVPSTRRRRLVIGAALLVGLMLVLCALRTRTELIGSRCAPQVLDARSIAYHSNHRFNTMIKTISPFPAPTFAGNHEALCANSSRLTQKFHYCLPISGRKDSDFCAGADRMDLLLPQSPSTRCHASVLHLLLVDVYEELQAQGFAPILTYGSLLGAVRNGSMIPFTEDTDIAYSGEISSESALADTLWSKGYHLFMNKIWRVCVAPTHPLAGNLYDPDRPIAKNFAVPYVDLYSMEKTKDGSAYSMQELKGRTLPSYRVEPFSQVVINGLPFDTVYDPEYFLLEEYGPEFKQPKPRNQA